MTTFDAPAPGYSEILALHGRWLGTKPAVIEGDRTLSWRDFDAAQNRIVNGLRGLGVASGDRVALVMTNSIGMVTAMFGILRAGAVIVPLNLAVTPAAMGAMLGDSGVAAVFVDAALADALDPVLDGLGTLVPGGRIVVGGPRDGWTEFAPWRDSWPDTDPAIATGPDDLFNIIYSSGTTGLPKGIAHARSRRLAFARDLALTLRFDTRARTLATIGLYSNISMSSALFTFLAGGTLVVHDGFDPHKVLAAIRTQRITHALMVPIQYQMIWDADGFAGHDLSSLRCLLSVGSALHAGLKARMIESVGPIVVEAYGLTEGPLTVIDGADCARLPGSVGKPVLGTDIRIIDGHGREVPPGTDGEIVGRGPHTMPCYYNNEAATRDAVWTDPQGRMWLRTGDLGRLDDDGFLYIVGRLKDMILSGGQNIYPSDIESVLITHDQVNDCAVIGIGDEKWGETPFAVVVPEPGTDPDAEALRDWINARVGKRQRVAGVAFRASLPRNPNGKVLKHELRAIHDKG
jgi:acyl-CoA synthetase (AMP-forming)/AMP-acid ligase II